MFGRREPVMIPGPNGQLMPKKAADQAWEIHNRQTEQLGQIRLTERNHTVQARVRETDRDQAKKDREDRSSVIAAKWAKVARRLKAFAGQLRNDLPLLFTLVTVGVSLTVTLSGQWMFYDTLPWVAGFGWLVLPMSLLVESGSWTYGVQAKYLADHGLPYGAKVRRMWLLAFLAAAMNSYHGATAFPGHWEMGLILGGGSILGPLAWHGYLQLSKTKAQGRSGKEIRAALGRRLHHPVLTWRAHDLWASTGGRVTPERAFLIAYRDHYGYLPGQRPAAPQRRVQVATVKVKWTPIHSPAGAESGAEVSAESGVRLSAEPSGDLTPPVIVTGAEDGPSTPPALALVGGDGSAESAESLVLSDDEIERFLTAQLGAEPAVDSALSSEQNSRSDVVSGGTQRREVSAEPSGVPGAESAATLSAERQTVEPPVQRSPGRSKPQGQRARRKQRESNKDRIRDYLSGKLDEGADLNLIKAPEVAAALEIGESTARNLLAVVKPELSDRHQQ